MGMDLMGMQNETFRTVREKMKIRVKLIPLALAESGMILASTIRGVNGQVMLTAGAELSDNLLASLHTRNISTISIQEEDLRSEEELAIEREKITKHIDALFQTVTPNSNLDSLRLLILDYRLEAHL